MLPIAVDAMGGDRAPGEIVAAAHAAVAEGIPVVLVGPADLPGVGDLPLFVASEVIEMDDDPAHGVRRKKDSTLVRAAELVRDGKASAMISAGNTGATMASALLRMGRIRGVSRPAIATPLPVPGHEHLARRRRQCRGAGRVARAVGPDGFHLRPAPLRCHRAPGGPAVDR
jgi:glycerol-3-phosphate acyltransferase PlsX